MEQHFAASGGHLLAFFLQRLADPAECDLARVAMLREIWLRQNDEPDIRVRFAAVLRDVLLTECDDVIGTYAVDALSSFLDCAGTTDVLASVAENRARGPNTRELASLVLQEFRKGDA